MSFLCLNNANIKFAKQSRILTYKSYIVIKALLTSKIKFIDKKKFAKVAPDKNLKTFVIYITVLEATSIYLSQTAQLATLQYDKALTMILVKYTDYDII